MVTSLHMICGLGPPPQSKTLATPMPVPVCIFWFRVFFTSLQQEHKLLCRIVLLLNLFRLHLVSYFKKYQNRAKLIAGMATKIKERVFACALHYQ